MPKAAAQNTPAVDSGKDAFAFGGYRPEAHDLKIWPISVLWQRCRVIVDEIDRPDVSRTPEDEEEIDRLNSERTALEREICGRVTTSIPELIIQVTVLQEFIELGSMTDDIDLLLAVNIITGLQRLNTN